MTTKQKTYGCNDCRMLKGKRCKLWEIKVVNPEDSHCESIHLVRETANSHRRGK